MVQNVFNVSIGIIEISKMKQKFNENLISESGGRI